MACACNVDLAAKLKQLASQFSKDDRRKLAACAAARNIAEHPLPIHTADDARAVSRVGPVILKLLKNFGVEDPRASGHRCHSPGTESDCKKHRTQDKTAEMSQPTSVPDFNLRLASDLRKMATDHPIRLAIADAVQKHSEELKTLQKLSCVSFVRMQDARFIIESVIKRELTPAEKAFADGVESLVASWRSQQQVDGTGTQVARLWQH